MWPYQNPVNDFKPQSGTSSIFQSPKGGHKGHRCSLHLQRWVTISKSISRWKWLLKNYARTIFGLCWGHSLSNFTLRLAAAQKLSRLNHLGQRYMSIDSPFRTMPESCFGHVLCSFILRQTSAWKYSRPIQLKIMDMSFKVLVMGAVEANLEPWLCLRAIPLILRLPILSYAG